ncbi:MAG: rhomboid family intramembrane serine protease [Candidatus Sumerlaeia bacterium]|nr:rhomboid family intramembrane serine protease [Candidatus Sumerlaeia bacterium]
MLIPVGVNRPLIRFPKVTIGIVVINVIVHFGLVLTGMHENMVYRLGYVSGAESLLTLITAMFLHGDLLHLLGNCFFFLVAGLKMEDTLGPWRFILFYVACGIAASALHASMTTMPIPMIGASGAIAGVLGGFLVMYPYSQVKFLFILPIYIKAFSISAIVVWGFWFIRELANMFFAGENSAIAFGAHVGGFAAGMIWTLGYVGWNRGEELEGVAVEQTSKIIFVADDYDTVIQKK